MALRQRSAKIVRAHVALDIDVGAGAVPTEFRIFKYGVNHSEKGDFLFDQEAAVSVMAEYRSHGKPMLLDYNHGTTVYAPTADQGISAGEFVPEVRADGLWATAIKWTDRARGMLAAREYRCFSPCFEPDPKTGRISRLINIALTNLPALDHVEPLVAATAVDGGEDMDEELKKALTRVTELERQLAARDADIVPLRASATTMVALSGVVGLAASASVTEVHGAVSGLVALRAKVFGLTGKQTEAEALGALQALSESHVKLIQIEKDLEKERTTRLSAEFATALSAAVTDSKVPPAQKAFWEGIATEDGFEKATARLRSYAQTAVSLTGNRATPPPGNGAAMTEQQKMIARRMNISESDWQKQPGGKT
jgi:phage I-like protein